MLMAAQALPALPALPALLLILLMTLFCRYFSERFSLWCAGPQSMLLAGISYHCLSLVSLSHSVSLYLSSHSSISSPSHSLSLSRLSPSLPRLPTHTHSFSLPHSFTPSISISFYFLCWAFTDAACSYGIVYDVWCIEYRVWSMKWMVYDV